MDSTSPKKGALGQKQQQQQQKLWDKTEANELLRRLKRMLVQEDEQQQIRQEFKKGKQYLQILSSINSQSKQLEKSKEDLFDTLQKLRQHHKFLQRQKELVPPLYLQNPFLMGGGGGASLPPPPSPALSLRGILEGSPYHPSPGGAAVSVPQVSSSSTSSATTTTSSHRYGTRRNSGGGSGPSGVPLQDMYKALTKQAQKQVLKDKK